MELTIKGTVYTFKFGIGFVREIDKTRQQKTESGTVNTGLQFAVASVIDEDAIAVVDILHLANKTENPRISKLDLEEYIDDENTDFEALCKEILDFFEKSNATRKKTQAVLEMVAKEKAKAETVEE